MEKWIPHDKREKAVIENNYEFDPRQRHFEIEGLDAVQGLIMTGGSETNYIEILKLFRKDAAERIDALLEIPEQAGLTDFITRIHALKGAAASIGAAALSAEAAALEAAAKRGDFAFMENGLPVFCGNLKTLTDHISAALSVSEDSAEKPPAGSGGAAALDEGILRDLKEALEAGNIRRVDTLLELLEESPPGAYQEELSQISNFVLLSEFRKAAELVGKLLETLTRTG
jgi:HPt (histidine-containing phosphotransfer) domain-containing protein